MATGAGEGNTGVSRMRSLNDFLSLAHCPLERNWGSMDLWTLNYANWEGRLKGSCEEHLGVPLLQNFLHVCRGLA